MRIAVIGSGISGNIVARLLSTKFDVQLFEAGTHAGGHSLTTDVSLDGSIYPADVGFMVFNDRTYPRFCEMLSRLGVASRASDMSFSVQCDLTGCEYQGSSLNGLFAQRFNLLRPDFLKLIRDILRFNHAARIAADEDRLDEGQSVREFLDTLSLGERFHRQYLIPMAAAIWSSVPNQIYDFPAKFLIGFFRNHGLLQVKDRPQWRTIVGGSRQYVDALLEPIRDRVRLNCPVNAVTRTLDHVAVQFGHGDTEQFDEVVFATHADQTLRLIQDASEAEREVLESFPYQANEAVLHTDGAMLPQRKRAWASWNYFVPESLGEPASVTYDLSRLQGLDSPEPILLTLNRTEPIAESRVIRRFSFHHPVFDTRSINGQRRFGEISGQNRYHYCGAYWRYGFHEDGLQSGLRVADHFGIGLEALALRPAPMKLPVN